MPLVVGGAWMSLTACRDAVGDVETGRQHSLPKAPRYATPPPPSRLGQATNLLYFRLVLREDVDNPVAGSHNMFPELLVILDRGLSICRGQDKAKLLLVPWTIIPVGDSS